MKNKTIKVKLRSDNNGLPFLIIDTRRTLKVKTNKVVKVKLRSASEISTPVTCIKVKTNKTIKVYLRSSKLSATVTHIKQDGHGSTEINLRVINT